MRRQGYVIEDEPSPSRLSHLTVKPLWPFLATMLAGGWFALPWFLLNGHAIGSATRKREIVTALVGFAGAAGIWLLVAHFFSIGLLGERYLPYLALLVPACKALTAYQLHDMQARSFELYEYFGGHSRNGVGALIAGMLLRGYVIGALPDLTWKIVVG
jgi:hypothetical protein